MIAEREFYSKILLFGEYSVIKDSMALAIPYPMFGGKLLFRKSDPNVPVAPDAELRAFAQYMESLKEKEEIFFGFDTTSLKFDLGQGICFESTIPQGYGVGSSGALVAALFERYGNGDRGRNGDIHKLKRIFSMMESHFHGASSGVDPLISYLESSVLISGKGQVETVDIPDYGKGNRSIFLLNTGRSRRTEPLVNLFLEKCNSPRYLKKIEDELIPITNKCITSFLNGDKESFIEGFDKLSYFQYKNFSQMIPKLYRDLWKKGLKSEEFYLKLCGAGGGGFLLGMTRDLEKTKSTLSNYEIRPLFSF